MGNAYWLKTQSGGVAHTERSDLGTVCRAAAQLDALSEKLALRPLSSFVDEGAAKRQLGHMLPELKLDAQAAAAEGHPIASGLETVTRLCELLMSNDDPLPPPPPSLLEQFMLPQVPVEQREAMMRWLNRKRPQLSVEAIVDELQFDRRAARRSARHRALQFRHRVALSSLLRPARLDAEGGLLVIVDRGNDRSRMAPRS